jgi:hypothetical protein
MDRSHDGQKLLGIGKPAARGELFEALSSSSMMKVTRRAVVSSSLRRPERERSLTAYGIMGEEGQLIYSWGTMERVSVVDGSTSASGKEA